MTVVYFDSQAVFDAPVLVEEKRWNLSDVQRVRLPDGCVARVGEARKTLILSLSGRHYALVQPEYKTQEDLAYATHGAKRDLDLLIERSGYEDSGTVFLPHYSRVIHSRAGADDLARRRLVYVVESRRDPKSSFLASAVAHVAMAKHQLEQDWAAFNPFATA